MHRPAPGCTRTRCARLKPADGGRSLRACASSSNVASIPTPADAIGGGLELAEDLDRWRTDRPLICTSEPFWRQTVPRSLRRQRRAIFTAALSLILIVATTAIAFVKSAGNSASARVAQDRPASGTTLRDESTGFQKTSAPHLLQADDFHVEIASPRLEGIRRARPRRLAAAR